MKVKTALLEKVDMQLEIINKQHEIICDLLNENTEQENLINELMSAE